MTHSVSPNSQWNDERGRQWLAHVQQMESTLNHVDAALLDALQIQSHQAIAEIGCGGGGTSLFLADNAPKNCHITGYDISPELVDFAQSRFDGRDNISFALADIGRASPPAEKFDRIFSRFGIMFFDDPPTAFANIRQFLKPDGRFAFAFWAAPQDNIWLSGPKQHLSDMIDFPAAMPDAPGPFRYANADILHDLMADAGFADIQLTQWQGKLPVGGGMTAEQAANFALSAFSAFSNWYGAASTEQQDKARHSLTTYYQNHLHNDIVMMHAKVHIMTGK